MSWTINPLTPGTKHSAACCFGLFIYLQLLGSHGAPERQSCAIDVAEETRRSLPASLYQSLLQHSSKRQRHVKGAENMKINKTQVETMENLYASEEGTDPRPHTQKEIEQLIAQELPAILKHRSLLPERADAVSHEGNSKGGGETGSKESWVPGAEPKVAELQSSRKPEIPASVSPKPQLKAGEGAADEQAPLKVTTKATKEPGVTSNAIPNKSAKAIGDAESATGHQANSVEHAYGEPKKVTSAESNTRLRSSEVEVKSEPKAMPKGEMKAEPKVKPKAELKAEPLKGQKLHGISPGGMQAEVKGGPNKNSHLQLTPAKSQETANEMRADANAKAESKTDLHAARRRRVQSEAAVLPIVKPAHQLISKSVVPAAKVKANEDVKLTSGRKVQPSMQLHSQADQKSEPRATAKADPKARMAEYKDKLSAPEALLAKVHRQEASHHATETKDRRLDNQRLKPSDEGEPGHKLSSRATAPRHTYEQEEKPKKRITRPKARLPRFIGSVRAPRGLKDDRRTLRFDEDDNVKNAAYHSDHEDRSTPLHIRAARDLEDHRLLPKKNHVRKTALHSDHEHHLTPLHMRAARDLEDQRMLSKKIPVHKTALDSDHEDHPTPLRTRASRDLEDHRIIPSNNHVNTAALHSDHEHHLTPLHMRAARDLEDQRMIPKKKHVRETALHSDHEHHLTPLHMHAARDLEDQRILSKKSHVKNAALHSDQEDHPTLLHTRASHDLEDHRMISKKTHVQKSALHSDHEDHPTPSRTRGSRDLEDHRMIPKQVHVQRTALHSDHEHHLTPLHMRAARDLEDQRMLSKKSHVRKTVLHSDHEDRPTLLRTRGSRDLEDQKMLSKNKHVQKFVLHSDHEHHSRLLHMRTARDAEDQRMLSKKKHVQKDTEHSDHEDHSTSLHKRAAPDMEEDRMISKEKHVKKAVLHSDHGASSVGGKSSNVPERKSEPPAAAEPRHTLPRARVRPKSGLIAKTHVRSTGGRKRATTGSKIATHSLVSKQVAAEHGHRDQRGSRPVEQISKTKEARPSSGAHRRDRVLPGVASTGKHGQHVLNLVDKRAGHPMHRKADFDSDQGEGFGLNFGNLGVSFLQWRDVFAQNIREILMFVGAAVIMWLLVGSSKQGSTRPSNPSDEPESDLLLHGKIESLVQSVGEEAVTSSPQADAEDTTTAQDAVAAAEVTATGEEAASAVTEAAAEGGAVMNGSVAENASAEEAPGGKEGAGSEQSLEDSTGGGTVSEKSVAESAPPVATPQQKALIEEKLKAAAAKREAKKALLDKAKSARAAASEQITVVADGDLAKEHGTVTENGTIKEGAQQVQQETVPAKAVNRKEALRELRDMRAKQEERLKEEKALEETRVASEAKVRSLDASASDIKRDEEAAEKAFKKLPSKVRSAAVEKIGKKRWATITWRDRLAAAQAPSSPQVDEDPASPQSASPSTAEADAAKTPR